MQFKIKTIDWEKAHSIEYGILHDFLVPYVLFDGVWVFQPHGRHVRKPALCWKTLDKHLGLDAGFIVPFGVECQFQLLTPLHPSYRKHCKQRFACETLRKRLFSSQSAHSNRPKFVLDPASLLLNGVYRNFGSDCDCDAEECGTHITEDQWNSWLIGKGQTLRELAAAQRAIGRQAAALGVCLAFLLSKFTLRASAEFAIYFPPNSATEPIPFLGTMFVRGKSTTSPFPDLHSNEVGGADYGAGTAIVGLPTIQQHRRGGATWSKRILMIDGYGCESQFSECKRRSSVSSRSTVSLAA